jgi:secondary thiamine-phosphate synthase enzyme
MGREKTSMAWFQHPLQLPPLPPGLHDITRHVLQAAPELRQIRIGLMHLFLQHTSASLTINEAADPNVPRDLDRLLDHLAPEDFPYHHQEEGPDDMPGHAKSSLLGCSLTVPIQNGRLCLGTWQGIFLCEHRQRSSGRRLLITLHGELISTPHSSPEE